MHGSWGGPPGPFWAALPLAGPPLGRARAPAPLLTLAGEHAREERTRDRSRRARDRWAHGTRLAPDGCARARSDTPAGRRGRAAGRVQGLRLQPAAVAGAAG